MKRVGKGLIFKLGGVLLLLLFIKLLMIGIGIYSAKHLKGDATAINYAGSERMRSYKLSFLIDKLLEEKPEKAGPRRDEIREEIKRFEEILKALKEGDEGVLQRYEEPIIIQRMIDLNPLFERVLRLPGLYEPELKAQIEIVDSKWRNEIKPLIIEIIVSDDAVAASRNFTALNEKLPFFVDAVDRFVTLLEDSSNRKVMVFYAFQYLFLLLTIAVTLIALYLIFIVTKKSVGGLMDGIRSMTAGDFSKRVAVYSNDEIGELAEGFNFMAQKLEELYGNLEKKVEEKTTALEERNRELSILYDMAASLNQSLPLDEILNVFLKKLMGRLNVRSGSIRLVDEEGSLRLASSIGLPDELKRANIAVGECLCGLSAKSRMAGFWDVSAKPEGMVLRDCLELGYKTVALVPINYKERLLGVLNLFQEDKREFTPQEKKLLESLSNHIGVAIEYYHLNAKAKRLAIMEERNILAHELHDSIAQSLAYLNIQTCLLEGSMKSSSLKEADAQIRQIKDVIRKGYDDVRELLSHFRTQMEEEGLKDALESLLSKFTLMTGIESFLESGQGGASLPPEAEVHVFHILQEALANVRKHSRATKVKVSLSDEWPLRATVEDNGVGFEIGSLDGKGVHHMGLSIMRERASKVGGYLDIYSNPGEGTKVILNVPKQA